MYRESEVRFFRRPDGVEVIPTWLQALVAAVCRVLLEVRFGGCLPSHVWRFGLHPPRLVVIAIHVKALDSIFQNRKRIPLEKTYPTEESTLGLGNCKGSPQDVRPALQRRRSHDPSSGLYCCVPEKISVTTWSVPGPFMYWRVWDVPFSSTTSSTTLLPS